MGGRVQQQVFLPKTLKFFEPMFSAKEVNFQEPHQKMTEECIPVMLHQGVRNDLHQRSSVRHSSCVCRKSMVLCESRILQDLLRKEPELRLR